MNNDLEKIISPRSPKITAMYQAVLDLLDEGVDIPSLKVIDITTKAGIGKGTAYDYFRSKEEIIVSAIIYNLHQAIIQATNRLEENKDFHGKFITLLNSMEEGGKIHENIKRFLPYWNCTPKDFSQHLLQEFAKFDYYHNVVKSLLFDIYLAGVNEGILVANKEEFFIETSFASQIMTYLKYLENEKALKTNRIEFKEYLYQNFIYLLRE